MAKLEEMIDAGPVNRPTTAISYSGTANPAAARGLSASEGFPVKGACRVREVEHNDVDNHPSGGGLGRCGRKAQRPHAAGLAKVQVLVEPCSLAREG